jgi:hypothetical protein
MKKTILDTRKLFLLSIILLPLNSYSSLVIRCGHPTGTYEKVIESDGGKTLRCSGDGSVKCQWENGDPGITIQVNGNPITEIQATNIVQQNINNNILQGTIFGDNNVGYCSWYVDLNNSLVYNFNDGQ